MRQQHGIMHLHTVDFKCTLCMPATSMARQLAVVRCRLLAAEGAILKAGGIVIRLVGLYHAGR